MYTIESLRQLFTVAAISAYTATMFAERAAQRDAAILAGQEPETATGFEFEFNFEFEIEYDEETGRGNLSLANDSDHPFTLQGDDSDDYIKIAGGGVAIAAAAHLQNWLAEA
ncbi:hypothetical protein MKB11_005015 [Salmonella enterica]|nr:hypothetical protein [Salmonella enterica]